MIGHTIKKIREAKGLSAYALSRLINMPPQQIHSIERSKYIRLKTLERIAVALKMRPSEILAMVESSQSPASASEGDFVSVAEPAARET